jgi:hypothetical protein
VKSGTIREYYCLQTPKDRCCISSRNFVSASMTFAYSPDGGKINITMSVKGQMYDILDYFDLIRIECGVGLVSTR